MQKLGASNILEAIEYVDKALYVVPVNNAKVAEVEALKEVAIAQYTVLHGVARAACQLKHGWYLCKDAPKRTLKVVVPL